MSNHFKPVDWSYQSNIYEVNLRQYGEDISFKTFAKELPRLRDMGIEILWFMPITPISVAKRKGSLGSYYASSDYTDTNPEYGTVQDFKELVSGAQQMGFKVIIDWVANHTGWDHCWTSTHPEYYIRDGAGNFTERNGWDDVIDLNYDNPDLRMAMIESMKFWVNTCNIDGFRCDMAHLVVLDFWLEARAELDLIKKLFWLAECEEAAYHAAFDATYTWRWMHQTESFIRNQVPMHGLWDLLKQYNSEFPQEAFRAYFTSNHDENTWNGTEYEKYGSAAINLAVFSCTWNGLPLIYSGQEMPNYKRLKFFDKDPIEWNGQFQLHDFYKTLLTLRRTHASLRAGDSSVETHPLNTSANDKVFSFRRIHPSDEVLVCLNFSAESIDLQIQEEGITALYTNCFTKQTLNLGTDSPLHLPAWSYLVFEKQ